MPPRQRSVYVRNVIFGVEDSLAATVGLLSGIAAEGVPLRIILLTGFVYIFVEAFSMGVGSFLSEESAQEMEGERTISSKRAALGGLTMFVSCVLAGFLPILPYLFFDYSYALYLSIGVSLAALGVLGLVHAKLARRSVVIGITRMVLLGGMAIGVGIVVGRFFGI